MLNKIQSNPNFKHFALYCTTFAIYGGIITALGPLIPYFSAYQKRKQTDYSILFFSRAIGYFIMGIGMKTLQKYFGLHNLIIIGLVGAGINFSIFAYCDQMLWKCFFVCWGSIFCCILQIAANVSVLVAHTSNEQQFWMQLAHGVFGLGGLFGPFIVYSFQLDCYLVMAVCLALTAPFYCILKSPEETNQVNIEEIMSQRYSQNKIIFKAKQQSGQEWIQPVKNVKQPKVDKNIVGVPKSIQILLSFAFFLYIGLQTAFGGWISSYAVMQGVSSKQQATFFSSMFWVSITIFRFVFACIPGKISSKIENSLYICLGIITTSIILVLTGNYYIAIITSSIVFGIGMAPLFPLFFTISGQFGMELGVSQSANLCIYASMGQAILSMIVGYLMGFFTPNMIFYGLLVMAISLYLIHIRLMKQFHQNQIQSKPNEKVQAIYQLKQHFMQK